MANRRPLVLVDGQIQELPTADALTGSGAGLSGVDLPGRQTIWLPAHAWTPCVTNPPTWVDLETATGLVNIKALEFDFATQQFVQTTLRMPKSWTDNSALVCQAYFYVTATGSANGIRWKLQCKATQSGEALGIDNWSTGNTTGLPATQNQLLVAGFTDMTIPQTVATESAVVHLQLSRDVSNAGDTFGSSCLLLGLIVRYDTNLANDT